MNFFFWTLHLNLIKLVFLIFRILYSWRESNLNFTITFILFSKFNFLPIFNLCLIMTLHITRNHIWVIIQMLCMLILFLTNIFITLIDILIFLIPKYWCILIQINVIWFLLYFLTYLMFDCTSLMLLFQLNGDLFVITFAFTSTFFLIFLDLKFILLI
jgi:hypothetical protein